MDVELILAGGAVDGQMVHGQDLPVTEIDTPADGASTLPESSVARLHFVGAYAALSFGPVMRFVSGTRYAARAVADRIARGLHA